MAPRSWRWKDFRSSARTGSAHVVFGSLEGFSQPANSMSARLSRLVPLLMLGALAACKSDGVGPTSGLEVGQSLKVTGAQNVKLDGGSDGAEFYAVLANSSTDTTTGAKESYTLLGSGLVTPSASLSPANTGAFSRLPSAGEPGSAPVPDYSFEARLRARERAVLTARIPAARAWFAARRNTTSISSPDGSRTFSLDRRNMALPSTVKAGDTVTVNVNGVDACDNPTLHRARVAAIGTHSIILADTANPPGGFTDADFQRYAARFDTLVYPVDVTAFGAPSDIDNNGRVAIIFTVEVNKLTPRNADFFFGGFTFARDLFPIVGTTRLASCPASNEGEYFYLLTPDPLGTINGNVRTAGFVDSNTTAVIAHEFQHLINSSRRIYVNNAPAFEDTWLDEGLAHIAEELLFYREAGVGPRNNLTIESIRATTQRRSSFNLDMSGNAGRYRSYLLKPSASSPYANNDSLSTRGATWDLLRYLADHKGSSDGNTFFQLVNSQTTGIANVTAVFGSTFPTMVRDWNVSHAVDDIAPVPAEMLQPSWDWHSIYPPVYSSYPLPFQTMTSGTSYSGTVIPGGSAYFKLAVPSGNSATITLGGQSANAGSHLQLVVVRTR
jgi:hypothetical protein